MKKDIKRIENILNNSNPNDDLVKELKTTYESFKNSLDKDLETNKLYISYMNKIVDKINERNKLNRSIILIILSMIITISLCIFNMYFFVSKKDSLNEHIIKANTNTSLIVNYSNLNKFNAIVLIDDQGYEYLEPISINLKTETSSNYEYRLKYNIYLIPEIEDNTMDFNSIRYSITNGNTLINNLKDQETKDDKILIYSSTISNNSEETIDLRMWITEFNEEKYSFKFKIYVDSYVE